MTVRNFTWNDLSSLTSLINQVRTADGDERILDSPFLQGWLTQPGLSPERDCWLVEEGGEVTAYAILYPELRIGRTVLEMGVPPSHRGGNVETLLVQRGIGTAKEIGARVLHVCASPASYLSGILTKEGFYWTRRYWMMRWQEGQIPSPQPPSGFSITTFHNGEAERLAQVQNASFEDSWGFCPNTIEEVAYRVRLSITPTGGIFFLRHAKNTAGYCWTYIQGDTKSPIGIIGMMGITPTYRGRGLSKPTVLAAMEFLHASGVKYIELNVDGENAAATRLYHSVGFEKKTELHWFEVRLSTV